MGDVAEWMKDRAMTDAEEWFEDEDMATELALAEGPPDEEMDESWLESGPWSGWEVFKEST